CTVLAWVDIVLSLLPYFCESHGAAFMTLRVCALSGRDWRTASLVCLLMVGPIADNVCAIPLQTPDHMPPPYNCEVDNVVSVAVDLNKYADFLQSDHRCFLSVLTPFFADTHIAADSMALIVTWWKTYRLKKAADAARVKTSIADLLLRDVCFTAGTMLVLNVLHVMINHVDQVSFMGDIVSALTSILASRFMMNLRDIDRKDIGQVSRSADGVDTWHANANPREEGQWTASEQGGTIVFERAGDFVDSTGGRLEHSMARLEDDESWIEGEEVGQVDSSVEGGDEHEKGGGTRGRSQAARCNFKQHITLFMQAESGAITSISQALASMLGFETRTAMYSVRATRAIIIALLSVE
ncbi:hypothetical protein BV20DRAFT_948629, partial [Pilatotrama ljubarskyi]